MVKKKKNGSAASVYTYLKETVTGYSGKSEEYILLAPHIFELLTDLLSLPEIEGKNRLLLTSAVAYFVAPRDVISEQVHGAYGFIDDLYLSAYVLKALRVSLGVGMLRRSWREEGDISEIIDGIYKESLKSLSPSQREQILIYSGVEEVNYPNAD